MKNTSTTPPFLTGVRAKLIPVLAVFGLPTATLAYFLTKHPLLALAILCLYELGVFVVGFIVKVWNKLEEPLIEYISSWLMQRAINVFSHYHRQYYRYLIYQHRDFDVKGLSTLGTFTLELDQVFVELSIDPSTPQSATVNPVQVPQTLLEGRHTVWDYLKSVPLRQQHLVVVGPPGSGKTTLLKHITLSLVMHRRLFHPRRHDNRLGKVPILLFLRDHAQAIVAQQQYSLVHAVRDHLSSWEQPLPPEGWFERQLQSGRCLIMLDGLDEVADQGTRLKVVNWVERQMARWNKNRFVVTSRPFGYRYNPLPNVAVLEVRPFTPGQVERFVKQWYLANEIKSKQKDDLGVHMRAKAEARALLQKLRTSPALFDLTSNPLLLTMIATVHRYGGELPDNRVALYAEICEVFLGKRQQARGQVLKFSPAKVQSVLEPLAYYMMLNNIRDIAFEDAQIVIEEPLMWISRRATSETFLLMVENMSGLLLERENGIYSFAHLTFQEYLAASYIKEKQLGHTLTKQVMNPWWQETIRLYCAMEDATPIIAACLEEERPGVSAIELAIDCGREAQKIDPEVQDKLDTLLQEGVEDADTERQHLVADALLARRLRQMIHLRDEIYVDTSFISCAEYQVFLDEQRAQDHHFQPDHWTSSRFVPGYGNEPVLGVRASAAEAFCAWLTEREAAGWRYRLPTPGELERDSPVLRNLPSRTGFWLENRSGFAWVKDPLLLPETLRDREVEQLETFIDFQAIVTNYGLTRPMHEYFFDSRFEGLFTNVLTYALAYASSLMGGLAHDQNFANSSRNRAHTLASVLDVAHYCAGHNHSSTLVNLYMQFKRSYQNRTPLTVLDVLSILTKPLRISRILDLPRTLAGVCELVRVRSHALPLVLDLDHINTVFSHLTSVFDSDGTDGYDPTGDPSRKLGHDLVNAGPFTVNRILYRSLTHASALTDELIGTLIKTLSNNLTSTNTHHLAVLLCRSLIVAVSLEESLRPFHRTVRTKGHRYQHMLDDLLDIYFGAVILQNRIEGELSACEGILMVKEKL